MSDVQQDGTPPDGWVTCVLGDYFNVLGGKRLPKGIRLEDEDTGYPYIRVTDFSNYSIEKNQLKFVPPEVQNKISRYIIESNNIYISIAGTIGVVGQVPEDLSGANLTENAARIVTGEETYSKFLMYQLASEQLQAQIRAKVIATSQPKLGLYRIKELKIVLPPLNEQKRIADKLEQLLARVDKVNEKLEGLSVFIRQFRRSVLQSATSGILLENSDSKLFSGIHDKSSFGFPASWEITTIEPFLSTTRPGMKTGPFGSLLKKSEYQSEGVPVVGIENIGAFDFVYGSKNYISEFKAGELDSYDLQPNDLIISRSGTVGEIAVIPHNIGEARFSTNIMRLVLDTSKIKPRYFQFLFKGCSFVLDQVGELCKGSTRDFINQKILKALIYPIPPLAEQVEILRRVEHLFAFADRLEERCIEAKKQVDKLTAAILAKAFRGELVPQDPNDEPAEKLLERIRKAKDLEKAKAKKRVKKLND